MDDDRRTRIRDAALEVFLRHGYRKVTMDDIAQGAGMSRPALYLVFPNKEAVFREVVTVGLDEMIDTIERGLVEQAPVAERLLRVFEVTTIASFEQVERAPAASELLHASFDFVADVFAEHRRRETAIVARILRDAVKDPGALRPSADAQARVLLAAVQGCKTAATDTAELRRLVTDLVTMVVAGLPTRQPRAARSRRA